MPTPGSSHALVLPSSSTAAGDPAVAGATVYPQLAAFLDSTKYSAVAVVHGGGDTPPAALHALKERRPSKAGVIWVPDAAFLPFLSGDKANLLRKLLEQKPQYVVSFFSVSGERVTSHLHRLMLRGGEIDRRFNDAAQNKLTT